MQPHIIMKKVHSLKQSMKYGSNTKETNDAAADKSIDWLDINTLPCGKDITNIKQMHMNVLLDRTQKSLLMEKTNTGSLIRQPQGRSSKQ